MSNACECTVGSEAEIISLASDAGIIDSLEAGIAVCRPKVQASLQHHSEPLALESDG